jgi:hypothetical protein
MYLLPLYANVYFFEPIAHHLLSLHPVMNTLNMYILKIKGRAKIPDYVQLRDDNFTLLAYFRVDRPEKALAKCGLAEQEAKVIGIINEIPFGKVMKLEI